MLQEEQKESNEIQNDVDITSETRDCSMHRDDKSSNMNDESKELNENQDMESKTEIEEEVDTISKIINLLKEATIDKDWIIDISTLICQNIKDFQTIIKIY